MKKYNVQMTFFNEKVPGGSYELNGYLNGFQTYSDFGLLEGEAVNGISYELHGHSKKDGYWRAMNLTQMTKRNELSDRVILAEKPGRSFEGVYYGKWRATAMKLVPDSHWNLEEDSDKYGKDMDHLAGTIIIKITSDPKNI